MEADVTAASQIGEVTLTLFERHVKQALKWYDDAARLADASPLVSPYFLGRALRDVPRPVMPRARGEVLRASATPSSISSGARAVPAARHRRRD
jgi:hypothetical protein